MTRSKWLLKRAVLGAVLSLAAIGLAFFAATYISDGSHEAQTGHGDNVALPVNISFPDGLSPTNPVAVTADVVNTSGAPRVWQGFTIDIETPAVPACASWLTLRPERENGTTSGVWQAIFAGTETEPLEAIPTGTQDIFASRADLKAVWLEFDPAQTGIDQSSCEETTVKLTGHLE